MYILCRGPTTKANKILNILQERALSSLPPLMPHALNRPFKIDELLGEVIRMIYSNSESSKTYTSTRSAEYGRTNLTLELSKEQNMEFPFLICEEKCTSRSSCVKSSAALDIADRQKAHSMTLKVMHLSNDLEHRGENINNGRVGGKDLRVLIRVCGFEVITYVLYRLSKRVIAKPVVTAHSRNNEAPFFNWARVLCLAGTICLPVFALRPRWARVPGLPAGALCLPAVSLPLKGIHHQDSTGRAGQPLHRQRIQISHHFRLTEL